MKILNKIKNYLVETRLIPLIIILLFIFAFSFNSFFEVLNGYKEILFLDSILVTDFSKAVNIGAAFFNAAMILLFYFIIIRKLKISIVGPIYAGLFIICGFSFFGKTLINGLPIIFGVYLYSKFKKDDIRKLMTIFLFSTGISPIVSYLCFGNYIMQPFGVIIGVTFGVIAGFVITLLANHLIISHMGYNLYNFGFALGFLSLIFTAILRKIFNIEVDNKFIFNHDDSDKFIVAMIMVSLIYLITSFLLNKNVIIEYKKLLKTTGRLPVDYYRDYEPAIVFLNIGLVGLLSTIVVLLLPVSTTGYLFGILITLMGFAAMGKHTANIFPIILGSIIMVYLVYGNYDNPASVGAIFLSTALAPISRRYGILVGILTGGIHILIVSDLLYFHGPFNLYSNGFAAGIVGIIVIPIIEGLHRDKED